MTTYFGECGSDGSLLGAPAGYDYGGPAYLSNINTVYTCPGSGVQNVDSLGIYSRSGGTNGEIRCALYTTGWVLVFQWDALITVNDDTPSWREKLAANLTGTLTLTGGATYKLAFTISTNYPQTGYNTGSAGDWNYASGTEYTGGFPANLTAPSGGSAAGRLIMRCGVSSACTLEQEGFRFRNDDNDEANATWKDSQDVNINLNEDTTFRLRIDLNSVGDLASEQWQVECRYKPSGGAFGSYAKVI